MKQKVGSFLIFILFNFAVNAQDSICLLFVYGSKPKVKTEVKWFGGIHGGHVSISYKDKFISFVPNGRFHILPKKKFHSGFIQESDRHFVFDTCQSRYLMLFIPIDSFHRKKFDSLAIKRLNAQPYDYAFIGMRCASAAFEVLSNTGLLPKMSKTRTVFKFFYPKRLRKYLLKQSNILFWHSHYMPGRNSRKWEKD